jgi:hypothetical protein
MAKAKRGAPDKATRIKNRISRMEDSLEEAVLKGDERTVKHYLDYLEIVHQAALGELEGITAPQQASNAKVMLERAERILKQEAKKAAQEEDENEQEDNTTAPISLISLRAAGED